jgi:hypothetical protein
MDADTVERIAFQLDESVLLGAAEEIQAIPAGELEQAAIEWEAMTVNLSEPLGRGANAHVVLEMLRGMQHGYDPGDIAEVFGSWAVLPDRAEVSRREWLEELPRRLEGGA